MSHRRLLVTLLLASCAGPLPAQAGSPARGAASLRDARPDWISGESTEWPRHRYVLGVGLADDRASAEERGRAEVARVFTTRVEATTTTYQAERSQTAGGRTTTTQEGAVSDEARSTTDKLLTGVEIVATWQDPATRQIYALAALDRQEAAARLRAALEALDASAMPLAKAIQGPDRVDAGLAGLRLRMLAKARAPLVADLRVVTPGAEVDSAVARLRPAAEKAVARLVVSLAVEGDRNELVETGVAKGLAELGLTARREAGDGADLVVAVTTSVEDLGEREGWTWTRAAASVTIREARGGQVVVQLEESAREGATLPAEGPRRALKGVAERLAARIPPAFEEWLAPRT